MFSQTHPVIVISNNISVYKILVVECVVLTLVPFPVLEDIHRSYSPLVSNFSLYFTSIIFNSSERSFFPPFCPNVKFRRLSSFTVRTLESTDWKSSFSRENRKRFRDVLILRMYFCLIYQDYRVLRILLKLLPQRLPESRISSHLTLLITTWLCYLRTQGQDHGNSVTKIKICQTVIRGLKKEVIILLNQTVLRF